MQKTSIFLLIFFSLSLQIYAAPFRHFSNLINVPAAESFQSGDLEVGTAISPDLDYQYDFDYMLNYSPTDRIKFGMTYLHQEAVVFNVHTTFYKTKYVGVGTGLRNMKAINSVSTRREYPDIQHNTFSPYFTSYFGFPFLRFHLGIGGSGFETVAIEENQSPFGAIEILVWGTRFIAEHDGKDLNVGFKFITSENTDFSVAITQIGRPEFNEEYNNAPSQVMALAFNRRFNLKTAYYKKVEAANAIQKEINRSRNELNQLHKEYELEIEQLRVTRLQLENDVKALSERVEKAIDLQMKPDRGNYEQKKDELVMDLYSKSFDFYTKGDYYKALQYISKAVRLEPNSAMLYMRMGSIYFKLEQTDMALESWEIAKQLDPDNETIDKLLQSVKK